MTTPTERATAKIVEKAEKRKRAVRPVKTVTYSEMDCFRQCPLKHRLAYVEGWRIPPKEGSALARGTLVHQVMERHYLALQGVEPRDRTKIFLSKLQDDIIHTLLVDPFSGEQTEDQELVEWIYRGYVDYWGGNDSWDIIHVERPSEVTLKLPNGYSSRIRLRYKIDLLIKDRSTGNLVLVDHKTMANMEQPMETDIDDQFGLYMGALRQEGFPVAYTVKNKIRTRRLKTKETPLEERFAHEVTYRTDEELFNIQQDFIKAARSSQSKMLQLYSSPDPRTCNWKCDFLQAHYMARKGIPFEVSLPDLGFEKLNNVHPEYSQADLASLRS